MIRFRRRPTPAPAQPIWHGSHGSVMAMTDADSLRTDEGRATTEVIELPLAFPATRGWWLCFAGALALLALWLVSVAVLFGHGVVVWGNTIPVNWGMAIINYVWFLGIGHAGTLISDRKSVV